MGPTGIWLNLPVGEVQGSYAFTCPECRFEVSKPASWQFVTAEQNLENLRNTKLNDEEFHRLMLRYSNAPLVAMMKHPEPFGDLNPSFKVQIKPFGGLKGADPKQILALVSNQMKGAFKDFAVTQAQLGEQGWEAGAELRQGRLQAKPQCFAGRHAAGILVPPHQQHAGRRFRQRVDRAVAGPIPPAGGFEIRIHLGQRVLHQRIVCLTAQHIGRLDHGQDVGQRDLLIA